MKYAGKKIITSLLTIIMVSLFVFLAFALIPGDPATSMLGISATPEKVAVLREEMGLNRPLPVRFADWAIRFAGGDMGISYSYNMPVKDMILNKIPITLTLTAMAFLVMTAIAFPLGIYTAKHEGSRVDKFIYVVNQVLMAVPPFFAGIMMTYVFGLILKWFTPGGFVSYDVNMAAFLTYMIFPALAVALPKSAMAARLLRTSILEQRELDYVRTAYSRGNTSGGVLRNHILKNACIPVITFLGMALSDMIAGSIVIEQVFSIPGLGRILLTSISGRDYPVVQAIIVCVALFVIIINFAVDMLYRIIDPRIQA